MSTGETKPAMDQRTMIAVAVLTALCGRPGGFPYSQAARMAVNYADALLAELAKTEKESQ